MENVFPFSRLNKPDDRSDEQGVRPLQSATGRHHLRRRQPARTDFPGIRAAATCSTCAASYADGNRSHREPARLARASRTLLSSTRTTVSANPGVDGGDERAEEVPTSPRRQPGYRRTQLGRRECRRGGRSPRPSRRPWISGGHAVQADGGFRQGDEEGSGQQSDVHDPVAGWHPEQLIAELGPGFPRHRHFAGHALPVEQCRPNGSRLPEARRRQGRLLVLRHRGLRHGARHGRCAEADGKDPSRKN